MKPGTAARRKYKSKRSREKACDVCLAANYGEVLATHPYDLASLAKGMWKGGILTALVEKSRGELKSLVVVSCLLIILKSNHRVAPSKNLLKLSTLNND